MSLRSGLKQAATRGIRLALRSRQLETLLTGEVLRSSRSWRDTDAIFTRARRHLAATPAWRYGPPRVREVARQAFDAFAAQGIGVEGKKYLDLGCGAFHPLGISAVMYLNGASATLATDLRRADGQRAAEALYDLLADCALYPEEWHWSSTPRDEFLARVRRFGLRALREGRLEEGTAEVPLRYEVSDITRLAEHDGTVELMASRAVLEHFLDFAGAMRRLYALAAPGAAAFHHIDLVDHRIYDDPAGRYHAWSFLAEGEEWSDGVVNRLRASEIRAHVEAAGWQVARFDLRRGQLPEGFRARLRGRFAGMSDEDLETTGVDCLLRKPAS